MNAIAPAQQPRTPSAIERYVSAVFEPEDRIAIKAALPAHIPFDRFERNLSNAVMNNFKLLDCNPREVFREVAKIAGLGLMLDAQLGEAYLIADYNNKPQIRIGYRGLNKLARQSGEVSSINACEVRANDLFEIIEGTERSIKHVPDVFEQKGPRGDVVGYYAVVKYKDGETDFEPMSIRQIEEIRDKTEAYKAFKANRIKSTPWADHFGEMAKKTVFRRLMKRVPQSPDLAQAQRIEDQGEAIEGIAVDVTTRVLPPRAPSVPSLQGPQSPAEEEPPAEDDPKPPAEEEPRQPEQQQQQQAQPQPQRQAPAAPTAPKAPSAPPRAPQAPAAPSRAPTAPQAPKPPSTPAPAAAGAKPPEQLDMMGPGPKLGGGKVEQATKDANTEGPGGELWGDHATGYEHRLDACEDMTAYRQVVEVEGAMFEDAPDTIQARVTAYESQTQHRLAPNLGGAR